MLTLVYVNLIATSLHSCVVIPVVELSEGRQSRRPHPDLEVLVCAQVWEGVLGSIAVRVAL